MLMKLFLMAAAIAVLVPAQAAETFSPDAEGFIRNWLVLAPITFEGESGAVEIERAFVPGEATLTPRAGDSVTIDFVRRTWRPHQAADFFIDFYEAFGQNGGEYAAAYAVAYVFADEEMRVTLAVGANDQARAWLNGKEVFKSLEAASLLRDMHQHDVTLVKGQNVLVMKVVNEVNNWQACARFLRGGNPVTNLRVAVAPR
jgi:hypothetical protein